MHRRTEQQALNRWLLTIFFLSALALIWGFPAVTLTPPSAVAASAANVPSPAAAQEESPTPSRLTRLVNDLHLLYELHALATGDSQPAPAVHAAPPQVR